MELFIAYLLILKIVLCFGKFEKNICIGDVEIAFSTGSKNFNEARISCRSFGGDLVKIGNLATQTAIQNPIVVKPEYFIGALDSANDNAYQWVVDDTAVPKNPLLSWPGPANGYQNWKSNQPNKGSETCVALGVHSVYKWSDVYCAEVFRYICQRGSEKMLTISRSNDIVTCRSSALDVELRWEMSSDTSGAYQTTGKTVATLHLENANITEAGSYTCASATSSCIAEKNYGVTIDGTPTIQSVVNSKCNASLFVTWKPNKAAVGFIHRFSISDNMTFDELPNSEGYFTTEIPQLEMLTNYTVKIQVCETRNSCTEFKATSSGMTDGVTEPVTNATLGYSGLCNAAWTSLDSSATYTIQTKCTIDKYRAGGAGEISTNETENWKTTTFSFQPGSNRNCSAIIWAKGCGMISTSVAATGICTTPPKEPGNIVPPTLELNGIDKTINLPRPSEDSGLISCIFIVVCYNKCTGTQLTVQDLETASQIDVNNNTNQANTIALAISMSSVSGNQISLKLSQDEETSCDLYSTELVAARSSGKVITGNNVIDNNAKNVWAYAVTSTPSGSIVLLKTSSPIAVVEEVTTTTAGVKSEAGGGYMNFVAPVDDGTSINVRDLESRYNNMKNSGAFTVQYDTFGRASVSQP